MRDAPRRTAWDVLLPAGIALFLLNSFVFVLLGRFNADEGWYLYGSKLVYEGLRPYQDFLFTQPPLLPYLYGLVQHFFLQSIYAGRLTSVVFSVTAFLLSIKIAVNYGGKTAGGITSLLGGTFLFGIYFQSITKTYAMTTLFFILGLFFLASSSGRGMRILLSGLVVLLAVLARLPALLYAAPFLLYAFFVSGIREKILLGAFSLLACLWFVFLAWPNPYAEYWDIYLNFLYQWGDISVVDRLLRIVKISIPNLFSQFPCYILLAGILIILSARRMKHALRAYWALFIAAAGLFLFGITNLITGGYLVEYDVPLLFISFPLMGIAFAKIFPLLGKRSRFVLRLAIVAAVAMGLVRSRLYYYDLSGGQLPIEKIRKVAAVVAENSSPGDPVFALEALPVAVEAHRPVPQNMAQGQFSFLNTDTATANALHAVNGEMALSCIATGETKLVILTDMDWTLLRNSPEYQEIVDALSQNYRMIFRLDYFGQHNNAVEVYLRRANPPGSPG
jgi:hypothetical protein